jgi:integrase
MGQKSQELKRVGECLYRNGRKTYFALIKVGGKQIKRSLKTNDLPVAKRRLTDLRSKAERLNGKENRNIRFDELAANWLESIKPNLKPASWDRRRVAIGGLTPFFKGLSIKDIGFDEIDQWRQKRGSKISARSHNIELETLKTLLRYASHRGLLLDNHGDKFERRKQPQTVAKILSREEFLALIAGLRSAPKAVASGAGDMVEFLAYSGTRVGEAREVRFEDVNFEKSTLLITGGVTGTKNNEQRVIPLFPNLRSLLQRLKERRTPSPSSKIFTIRSPRGAMRNACRRTGLKQFTVHSLRHFFASNAIEEGINFKVIADWLGHSDGGVLVAKTYGHLRGEYSASMAERMTFRSEI